MNQDQLALLNGFDDIQELSSSELFEIAGGYYGQTTPPPVVTYPYWVPPVAHGAYGQPVAGYWVYAPKPHIGY